MLDYSVVSMPRGSRCLPCPWCDSALHLELEKGNTCHFWIQCRNFHPTGINENGCFACGPIGDTREEAVANWNHRPARQAKKPIPKPSGGAK
jgi:hypothetical protein